MTTALSETLVDPAVPGAAPARMVLDERTRRLLERPVLPTLVRLAAPNVFEAAARIAFITADAFFVAWLGNDVLAGVSVVFPLLTLMQTITAAGLGAGVAASVGVALGAGDRERARSLAGTAMGLALAGAALSSVILVLAGPSLYRAMGLSGAALAAASEYGAIVFGGCVTVWLMNTLANISRGAGNMLIPASAILIGEVFHLLLSPALIVGWGPFPRMGVAGAGVAVLAAYGVGALVIGSYLVSRRALVRLDGRHLRIRRVEAAAILRIGLLASGAMVVFQASAFLVTGLVGRLGSEAIAAYGAASRLELLQAPVTFAFASAVITMVATAIGAGDRRRARQAALTGMAVAAAIGVVFSAVAFRGEMWMAIFTSDPAIAAQGALYLLCLAPLFPIIGAGIAAYFATQAIGEVARPFACIALRFVIAVVGGLVGLSLYPGVLSIYLASALAALVSSLGLIAVALRRF
ncbi:MATE family efflux transporter [Chelatococcus reniformis]|uniref:Cation efflux system protein n=1 Tax=Chelatococcus reniformis TaxID=1494448 RepID=A0A916TY65_9HYPH|nr:MATE family efflux transporter [Chelatococcus reniformis]GGC50876.1 cation efflux system protein [Chelatococcus reniformis]